MNLRATNKLSIALLLFAVALFAGVLTHAHGINVRDDGNIVRAAQRVLAGEVPYVDFKHFFYAPGRVYLLAAIYDLFGESYLAYRWMWVVARAFVVLFVYLAGRELMPVLPSLLPAAVVLVVPGPWFKTFYPLCGILAFYAMVLYAKQPSALRAGWLGGAAAFGLFFRQDVGVHGLVVGALAIVLVAGLSSPRRWRRVAVDLPVMLGVALALLAPFLLYMAAQDALLPMLEQLFREAPGMTSTMHERVLPSLERTWKDNPSYFLLGCVTPVLATLVGLLVLAAKRQSRTEFVIVVLLLIMNVLTVMPAYLPISLMRFLQADHFTLLLLVYGIYLLTEHGLSRLALEDAGRSLVARGAAYLLIALVPGLLVHHAHTSDWAARFTGVIPGLLALDEPVTIRGETVYLSGPGVKYMERMMRIVDRHTRPGEPLVFIPNMSLYHYICDRPNPTRYIGLWAHRYDHDNEVVATILEDYLAELQEADPRTIVVWTAYKPHEAYEPLARHLEETYPTSRTLDAMDLIIFTKAAPGPRTPRGPGAGERQRKPPARNRQLDSRARAP